MQQALGVVSGSPGFGRVPPVSGGGLRFKTLLRGGARRKKSVVCTSQNPYCPSTNRQAFLPRDESNFVNCVRDKRRTERNEGKVNRSHRGPGQAPATRDDTQSGRKGLRCDLLEKGEQLLDSVYEILWNPAMIPPQEDNNHIDGIFWSVAGLPLNMDNRFRSGS